MKYIITIDTGTTNTRCILWDEKRSGLAVENRPIGVRNTAIDGHNGKLKEAVRSCLTDLMTKNGVTLEQIKCVIASGMITSNVGLTEIPHVVAPANKEDLARATTSVLLEDVFPLPIWFIPGIKNNVSAVDLQNFESMDIMRGEEVESVAIIEQFPRGRDYLLVLPGSHTKYVSVDRDGRMTGCLTTIGGELLSSIISNTIISDAVDRKFVEEATYDREMLLLGYRTAQKVGTGRACFSGRILNQFAIQDKTKIANYITGVVLQSDIAAVKNSDSLKPSADTTVIVAGKEPLRTMLSDLMRDDNHFEHIECFQNPADSPLSAVGAYLVAELCDILK